MFHFPLIMTLRRRFTFILASAIVFCAVSPAYALHTISNEGLWPKNWPKELEPLRKQSRTIGLDWATLYEIRFANRKEFESAWPHIMKLKSKGAPVTLFRGPHKKWFLQQPLNVGVRILTPQTGRLITPGGGPYPSGVPVPENVLKIGPPWPDYLKSESGALPEYVFNDDGRWSAGRPPHKSYRARLEVELIVDGEIIDLNRFFLPADTPIIDERFMEKTSE